MGSFSVQTSFFCATIFTVLLFCAMQMQRNWLSSTQLHTIFGGYLGSLMFTFLLTAIGNMETLIFGSRFHTKLFPEVLLCLAVAMAASGLIHRVCVTTCAVFSLVGLYYMNKSAKTVHPTAPTNGPTKKKK